MAAYFESGFSVRVPMWHGLGTVLDDYPVDWADARKKAGLEWEPRLVTPFKKLDGHRCAVCGSVRGTWGVGPLQMDDPVPVGSWVCECGEAWLTPGPTSFEPVGDYRLVVRDDTSRVLGMVSDQYQLVQHAEMGEIVDAVIGSDKAVRFETAGSIKDGAAVWALAYLDEPFKVARDDSESLPFLALLNSHDGTGACKVIFTRVRVVCWNTYQAANADAEARGTAYTFRHTGNVKERIEEAKAAIVKLREGVTSWSEEADELVKLNVDDERVRWFLEEFIPEPAADIVSPRVRANIEKARGLWRSFYEDSVTCDAHRGTALGLLDASVEYLDHARAYRNSDSRIGRSLLRPEPLKAKATLLARRVATGAR